MNQELLQRLLEMERKADVWSQHFVLLSKQWEPYNLKYQKAIARYFGEEA